MKKVMFWVGFALPLLHLAAYEVVTYNEATSSIVTVVGVLLIGFSREWSLITLLAIICALMPTLGGLYIPMSLELAVHGIARYYFISVAILATFTGIAHHYLTSSR